MALPAFPERKPQAIYYPPERRMDCMSIAEDGREARVLISSEEEGTVVSSERSRVDQRDRSARAIIDDFFGNQIGAWANLFEFHSRGIADGLTVPPRELLLCPPVRDIAQEADQEERYADHLDFFDPSGITGYLTRIGKEANAVVIDSSLSVEEKAQILRAIVSRELRKIENDEDFFDNLFPLDLSDSIELLPPLDVSVSPANVDEQVNLAPEEEEDRPAA